MDENEEEKQPSLQPWQWNHLRQRRNRAQWQEQNHPHPSEIMKLYCRMPLRPDQQHLWPFEHRNPNIQPDPPPSQQLYPNEQQQTHLQERRHPVKSEQQYPLQLLPEVPRPIKSEDEEETILGPTWLDLYGFHPLEWRRLMENYCFKVSSTSDPQSLNYQTIFSHDPQLRMDFYLIGDYRQDVIKQATAFLNSVPGYDGEPGNNNAVPLARQAKEGRLTEVSRVQKLDCLLMRRGHMARLAEWFLDQTSIFWVRAYHPITTFSQGLFWWPRADEYLIGDIGWSGPYLPDMFEFDACEFENVLLKHGTRQASQKYHKILAHAQNTKVFENACFIRPPPMVVVNDLGLHEQLPPDPSEDVFLGWEKEAKSWLRAECNADAWQKPYQYIAAAFMVSGIEENRAKRWIDDIAFRYKLDLEHGISKPVFVRCRFASPPNGESRRSSVAPSSGTMSSPSPRNEVGEWARAMGSARRYRRSR